MIIFKMQRFAAALLDADIFFYPLQPDHYGTAENALIEAMSLGLTPVVLDNPAETAIVTDSKNGFIAHSIEECISLLQMLLLLPDVREKVRVMPSVISRKRGRRRKPRWIS